jgi:uncharacterized repeat protein (TIGR01451 family)
MMKRTALKLLVTIGLCLLLGSAPARSVARPLAVANPSLTISAAPWPLVINQSARITVTASNPSGENADNVTVTSGVPNNMMLANVSATQGQINVFNMGVTVHAGTLAPGQTMYVYLDVVVVAAYPSDAPFNLCAGLTFTNGTARLSCLPNQPAGSYPGRPPSTLAPNGQRPIYDPNRPPVYLPISGSPIDLLGPIVLLGGFASLAIGLARRRIK